MHKGAHPRWALSNPGLALPISPCPTTTTIQNPVDGEEQGGPDWQQQRGPACAARRGRGSTDADLAKLREVCIPGDNKVWTWAHWTPSPSHTHYTTPHSACNLLCTSGSNLPLLETCAVDLFREIFLWRTPENRAMGWGMSCHFPCPVTRAFIPLKLASAGRTKGSLPWIFVRLVSLGNSDPGVALNRP